MKIKTKNKNRIKSTINVLKHLMFEYPDATELIEEQVANLEHVIESIDLWWEE